MVTSLVAFTISILTFYLSNLRTVDDLRVASTPPAVSAHLNAFSDNLVVFKNFAFAFVNSGNRDAVVLDAKLIVMQRSDDFPPTLRCQEGYTDEHTGEWSFNLTDVGASLKPGEVKVVRPMLRMPDYLYSGLTTTTVDGDGNLNIRIRDKSRKSGRLDVRVCSRFVVASPNSEEALSERDVVLAEYEFNLVGARWEFNAEKLGKSFEDSARPQILLRGSDDFLSSLIYGRQPRSIVLSR